MNTDAKIPNKMLANLIQQWIFKNHTPWSSGIYSMDARLVQYSKINKYDTSHTQNGKHMIISINARKAFSNIQHLFMIKTQKSGEEYRDYTST